MYDNEELVIPENEHKSVTGFRVAKFMSTEAKGNSPGVVTITLVGTVDDVRVLDSDLGGVMAALNLHQRAGQNVILKLAFPED